MCVRIVICGPMISSLSLLLSQAPTSATTALSSTDAERAEKERIRKERLRVASLRMNYNDVEANMKILAKMQNRVDYLKNPRYAPGMSCARVSVCTEKTKKGFLIFYLSSFAPLCSLI